MTVATQMLVPDPAFPSAHTPSASSFSDIPPLLQNSNGDGAFNSAMGLSSLPPGVPQHHILDWDENEVQIFLCALGYNMYEQQLKEHGITGEILVHLDHMGLKDVGVHSVGQRLAVLRAVYNLKLRDNVPIEEGHWVPPTDEAASIISTHDSSASHINLNQIFSLLAERDDRILALEQTLQLLMDDYKLQVNRLNAEIQAVKSGGFSSRGGSSSGRSGTGASGGPARSNSRLGDRKGTPQGQNRSLVHKASWSGGSGEMVNGGANGVSGDDVNGNTSGGEESALRTGDFRHPFNPLDAPETPLSSAGPHRRQPSEPVPALPGLSGLNPLQIPNLPFMTSKGTAITPGGLPITPNLATDKKDDPIGGFANGSQQSSTLAGTSANNLAVNGSGSASAPSSPTPTVTPNISAPAISLPDNASGSSSSNLTVPGASDGAGSGSGGSKPHRSNKNTVDNPYKSFRVTMDDPCHKVLPAALKKYKINDDWRQYALFILFGPNGRDKEDRCLAYDEKPLLLFQRLRETDKNPVFMLRHIKDIKSPIAVAAQKQEQRRAKKAAERVAKEREREQEKEKEKLSGYSRNTRLHHAPVLQPVGKDKEKDEESDGSGMSPKGGANAGMQASTSDNNGYCIAIYPYVAEREDEFDVRVGDTFVIVSRANTRAGTQAKGWWIVYRDRGPRQTPREVETIRSGWVPAGCLLQTEVPPLQFSSSEQDSENGIANARNVVIPPQYITSVSTAAVALMDYSPKGADELKMKKDDPLKVYKRYNHWSYAVNEAENGVRGWAPSWYIGKVVSSSKEPTPTTSASMADTQAQASTS